MNLHRMWYSCIEEDVTQREFMKSLLIICVWVIVAGANPAIVQYGAGVNPAPATITLTDDTDRTVTIPLPVQRVITLAPSDTQLVSALGMTAAIAGASSTDDNPLPSTVKRIGSINPSIEKIISLRPDLVLGIYGEDTVCSRLQRLDVPCMILSPSTPAGVMHDIQLAGRIFSADTAASLLIKNMKQKLAWIQAKLRSCRTTPLVYFEIDDSDPARPFSAGRGSFIDDLITMAHAANIAHTIKSPWPQLSGEYILARDPDVIILSDKLDPQALKKRPGWKAIKAVRTGRVYTINMDLVARPGPDIIDAFEEIAKDIHPREFGR